MSISILLGLVVAFGGLIFGYSLENGNVMSLLMASPFIIVFLGTWGAIITSFGVGNTAAALKAFLSSLSRKNRPNPEELINKLCEIADASRKGGILSVENMLNDSVFQKNQYLPLKAGLIMLLDMKGAEHIEIMLESDMGSYVAKRQGYIDVFQSAAGFSPTLGIIGTVMGLVQVLSNMSDAAHLTAAIAVAFIATLYGVVFANLLYMPIANQLKYDLKLNKEFKRMISSGLVIIAEGGNARTLVNQLSVYYQAFPNGDRKYKEGISK